ncbi:MAG: DUF397 domain-containing protein [Gammaproteobacteria bacterium]
MRGSELREKEAVGTNVQQHVSLAWRKSTASGSGACVEVARAEEMILVRDSKNPAGPAFAFSGVEWEAFLADVRVGRFDV